MKSRYQNLVIGLLLAGAWSNADAQTEAIDDFAPAHEPVANPVRDAFVEMAVLPTYPRRALKHNIDGEITIEFTITRYGRAVNPKIVSESPRKVFRAAALDALRYWFIAPGRADICVTKEQVGEQTFRFRHDDSNPVQILPLVVDGRATMPRPHRKLNADELRAGYHKQGELSQMVDPAGLVASRRVEPEYPEKALERRREGFVTVSFFIEKDGRVSEAKVEEAKNGSFFNRAALRAIRQWKFEPSVRHSEAGERLGCHEFMFNFDASDLARQRAAIRERTRKEVF